jgi:hypothetical protein
MVGRIVTPAIAGPNLHGLGIDGYRARFLRLVRSRFAAFVLRDLGQVMVVGLVRRMRLWALRRTRGAATRRRPLAELTTPQLCALWRKSHAGLYAAPTAADRARVAAARGILLDELEHREPDVMADWLQSGAREPEGPSAYLVR